MKQIDLEVRVTRGRLDYLDSETGEPIVGRYHLKYTQTAAIKRMHTRLMNDMMREYPDWREISVNNVEV